MSFEQPMLCPACVDSSGRLRPVHDCKICHGTWVVLPDWRHLGGVAGLVGLFAVMAFVMVLVGSAA